MGVIIYNFAIKILQLIIMKKIKVMVFAVLTILAAACNDNDDIADIEKVKPVEIVNGQENGFDYADLELPSGTLWATCNVGATSPEQTGLYFAFGETTGFTAEQVTSGVRVFDENSYNEGPAASIYTDLTLEQDAAHVNLGGRWRMPTMAEFKELFYYTNSRWTYDYKETGVAGRIFTSKVNGNSIFFPAAGWTIRSSVNGINRGGCYWTRKLETKNMVWYLDIYSKGCGVDYYYRYYGKSVRGVYRKN